MPIPCFIAFFKTPYGIASLIISGLVSLIGALIYDYYDRKAEEQKYGWRD